MSSAHCELGLSAFASATIFCTSSAVCPVTAAISAEVSSHGTSTSVPSAALRSTGPTLDGSSWAS